MDHAPAPSWLDSHLDSRPGWADAPANGVLIDPATVAPESPLDEPAAPAGESWLDDATIDGMVDEVDQIEITDDDLPARNDIDDEFAVPDGLEAAATPSLVDPFDEFVAETEAPAEELPDATVDTDDADDVAADVDVDDIAPAPTDDMHPTNTPSGSDDVDEAGPADTGGDPYDAFDSFDSFDIADSGSTDDAVADGVGTNDSTWAPEPDDDAPADTGYDAFDDLDEGTDG